MAATDVVIVGGGPAGAAAAITAARHGLRATIVEREPVPGRRPGEAAHPGLEPLLARLGVLDAVLAHDFPRHEGHWVAWGGEASRFVPFGADAGGPWRGFQLWRPTFDAIMLDAAGRAGAALIRPCPDVRPLVERGRVTGVTTAEADVSARFVVDASGRHRWLARHLGLAVEAAGPPTIAWFGYARGECPIRDAAPAIVSDPEGWTWTARVRPNVYQWVLVPLTGERPPRGWRPDELAALTPLEGPRGIDVTWTRVGPAAGPGYFLAGDAAFVLDPASSHGMLKAIMSGMKAAHLAAAVHRGRIDEAAAAADYDAWLRDWFARDVAELRDHYAALARGHRRRIVP